MTTLRRQLGWMAVGLGVVWAAVAPTGARADVAALEALQAAHPDVVHLYTFEGADDTARREDKVGSLDMSVQTSTGFTPVQEYVAGLDASTTASRSHNGPDRTTGSGLRSAASMTLPGTGTVEFLVRRTTTINDYAMAVGGIGTGTSRWYLWNSSPGQANLGLGNPGVYTALAGSGSPVNLTTNWYYVAHTWEVSDQTNLAVNSTVVAISSGGGAYRVSSSAAMGSVDGRNLTSLGIGAVFAGGDIYFDGAVDAVAVYDSALDAATQDRHIATLRTPVALRLENLQAADTNLVQHWTFEGEDDAARLGNNRNASYNLYRYTSAGFTPEQSWAAGYDGQGYSSRSYNGSTCTTGSALRTTSSALTLPTNATLEYLVKAVDINDASMTMGSVGAGTTRWFIGYNSAGYKLGLGHPGVYANLIGSGTVMDYVADRWYYTALTWTITGTNILLDGYVADMRRPSSPVLEQTITGMAATMGDADGNSIEWRLGLATIPSFFNGQLDAVAIYDRVYTKEELQARLLEAFPPRGTVVAVR